MELDLLYQQSHLTQLKKIADNKKSMPPKSTWFEPKLLDGLISMPII